MYFAQAKEVGREIQMEEGEREQKISPVLEVSYLLCHMDGLELRHQDKESERGKRTMGSPNPLPFVVNLVCTSYIN